MFCYKKPVATRQNISFHLKYVAQIEFKWEITVAISSHIHAHSSLSLKKFVPWTQLKYILPYKRLNTWYYFRHFIYFFVKKYFFRHISAMPNAREDFSFRLLIYVTKCNATFSICCLSLSFNLFLLARLSQGDFFLQFETFLFLAIITVLFHRIRKHSFFSKPLNLFHKHLS